MSRDVLGVPGGDEPQLRARLDLLAGHRHAARTLGPYVVSIAIGMSPMRSTSFGLVLLARSWCSSGWRNP